MKARRKFYPPAWDTLMRQEAFEEAGYCCQECGVQDCAVVVNPDKEHPLYPDGQPYMVHLTLAHRNEYETWNPAAETLVLCPACHGRFDAHNRRKDAKKAKTPIAYIVVRVRQGARWQSAATPWSYNELARVLAALPDAVEFELYFTVLWQEMGYVRCRWEQAGAVVVCEEAEGLGCFFTAAISDILMYA